MTSGIELLTDDDMNKIRTEWIASLEKQKADVIEEMIERGEWVCEAADALAAAVDRLGPWLRDHPDVRLAEARAGGDIMATENEKLLPVIEACAIMKKALDVLVAKSEGRQP